MELLSEFLLLVSGTKVALVSGCDRAKEIDDYFFDIDGLKGLSYRAPVRLFLKLFSLFNSSSSSNSFPAHKDGYVQIEKQLKSCFEKQGYDDITKYDDYLNVLEAMLQGFQVTGANRDWCAKSFIPISKNFLACETIWRETAAKNASIDKDLTFSEAVDPESKLFDHYSRDFYSRGGDVLYLQLLLALNASSERLAGIKQSEPLLKDVEISSSEKDPEYLSSSIEKGMRRLLESDSVHLSNLVDLIEKKGQASVDGYDKSVTLTTGWIPNNDTMLALGYLFAIELSRLLSSKFEAVQNVRMLELACAMQEMRTLLYAAAKKAGSEMPLLITVSPFSLNSRYKNISNNSFKEALALMRDQLETAADGSQIESGKKYGASVFRKTAKAIQFVVPRTGDNEHFVITKDLLILFVSTSMRPGEPKTIDDFLADIKARYGIAVDSDSFSRFNEGVEINQKISDPDMATWVVEMLDECGYYQPLSDSISLVINNNEAVEGNR